MSETAVKSKVEITSFTDDRSPAVAEFFRQVWDPGATEEGVRAGRLAAMRSNPFQPGQEIPTVLFLGDGKVLGYVTSIPVSLWDGVCEQPAFWVKGLMVLPEHRNGPIGYYLVKELLKKTPCALSLTVAPASRRLFQSLGFHELGMLTNHIRLLRPARIARCVDLKKIGLSGIPRWLSGMVRVSQKIGFASLAAATGGAALNCVTRLRTPALASWELSFPDAWPAAKEIDALWERMRGSLRLASVRDSRYLPWRYDIGAGRDYGIAVLRKRQTQELAGIAVLRRPRTDGDSRLNGVRLSMLSDVIFDLSYPSAVFAVLKGAERLGRAFDADAVVFSTASTRMRQLISRAGYLPFPPNLYFLWRDARAECRLSTALADWWLTRGDMNADEVF